MFCWNACGGAVSFRIVNKSSQYYILSAFPFLLLLTPALSTHKKAANIWICTQKNRHHQWSLLKSNKFVDDDDDDDMSIRVGM